MKRTTLPVLAAIVATCLVALLAWQNRDLRRTQGELETRVREPYPGMFVPQVATLAIDGAPLDVGAPAADFQVLYFFMPDCPYCAASAASIRALSERLARETGGRVPLIGVGNAAVDELLGYVRDQRFGFPIASITEQRTLALFRASIVPLVLVVDRNGRVHHATVGTFDSEAKIDLVLAAVRGRTLSSGIDSHDRS